MDLFDGVSPIHFVVALVGFIALFYALGFADR